MMRIKKFEAKKVIVFLKKFFSVSQNNALGEEASLPSLSSVSSLTTVFYWLSVKPRTLDKGGISGSAPDRWPGRRPRYDVNEMMCCLLVAKDRYDVESEA